MKQKYIDAVRYFRKHPNELKQAWKMPSEHKHGCLFQFCSPDGRVHMLGEDIVGCPIMIAGGKAVAWSQEMTEKCRTTLPADLDQLRDRDLVQIARLQNEMDETIRNPYWLAEHEYACHPLANDPLVRAGLRNFGRILEEDETIS